MPSFLNAKEPSVQRRFTSPEVTERLSHSACGSESDDGGVSNATGSPITPLKSGYISTPYTQLSSISENKPSLRAHSDISLSTGCL